MWCIAPNQLLNLRRLLNTCPMSVVRCSKTAFEVEKVFGNMPFSFVFLGGAISSTHQFWQRCSAKGVIFHTPSMGRFEDEATVPMAASQFKKAYIGH